MEDSSAVLPVASDAAAPAVAPIRVPRWFAVLQVVITCGFPTQVAIAAVLIVGAGMPMPTGDQVSLEFLAMLSLIDTAVIALLIKLFLSLSHENSHDVFLGRRPVAGEILRGLLFLPAVFIGVTVIILAIRTAAPWMQTFERSPLEAFMRTPFEAAIFAVVVVLAGGIREELQRSFILHRFEQGIYFRIGRFTIGGLRLGLTLFSLTFAVLHIDQGLDVAFAIGLLGLLWGVLYIQRRSAVMSMVNHAGFNALQIVQYYLVKAFVPAA